jgi:alcohol dehydrogenase
LAGFNNPAVYVFDQFKADEGQLIVTHSLPYSDVDSLTAEERTLKGSYIGSCVPRRDLPHFVSLFRSGQLPVDKLLTHRLRLEEINEGFDRMRDGQGIRQVVIFD